MSQTDGIQRVGVIMAGGSGERFWPVSRAMRPKQLLHLASDDETLLEAAVRRVAPLITPEHVYVATGEHLLEPIRAARVGVPDENVIAEPCKRNTAGCLCYAAAHVLSKYRRDPRRISMTVTTADHLIEQEDRFLEVVRAALEAAEQDGALATLGVVPARPDTGYGYIQVEEDVHAAPPGGAVPVFRVVAFREKPGEAQAREFVDSGRYFWNSGMFMWRLDTFLDQLRETRPDLAQATLAMAEAMGNKDNAKVRSLFEALENISIDYALMEKATKVLVARADFTWDDAGTWSALDRMRPGDEAGNVAVGNPVLEDCRNCVVFNEPGAGKTAVAAVGLEDMVVVVTDDAVLVMPKGRDQDVKRVVAELKERNARQL